MSVVDIRQRYIIIPMIMLALASVLVVGGSFYFAYIEVDRGAEFRQAQTLQNAILQTGNGFQRELMGQTVWTDAFVNTTTAPDLQWISECYSYYLTGLLGYAAIYVLDTNGKPFYGFENGVSDDGTSFVTLEPALEDLVQAVGDATPAVTKTSVDLGENGTALHRSFSDMRLLNGKPYLVVLETILPDADAPAGTVVPDIPAMLLATYPIDQHILDELGQRFEFSDLHWTAGSPADIAAATANGRKLAPIQSSNGQSAGALAWKPNLPVHTLLEKMSGGFGAALALLGILAALAIYAVSAQTRRMLDWGHHDARLARTDFLTGLPNRLALNEAITAQCTGLGAGQVVGLLNIDLNGFKQVNDTLGHQAGDAALKAVGQRLASEFPDYILARTGGDEFAMLAATSTADRVRLVADRLCTSLTAPVELADGLNVPLSCSIGYAIAPMHGVTEAELMRRADLALYRAKKEGMGGAHGFDAALEAAATRRLLVDVALRRAVETGSITVAYQPLLGPDGATMLGVEALARWHDPELGHVPPSEFIPIAEETGIIVKLGEQVLRRAMLDAANWDGIAISVNVSAQQIQRVDIVATVERLLKECSFPGDRLEIELTESLLIADEVRADVHIRGLQHLGVKVALDDFGTGYASLIYLRHFGFDKLKIDRSFVNDIDTSADARAMITSITAMSRALGLEVTAEGVETTIQHDFLRTVGCHRLQGFLFSKAITAAELSVFLRQKRLKSA